MDDLAEAALQAAVVRTLRAAAAVASEPEDLGTSRGPTGAGAASTVVTESLDVSSPSSAADATSSTEPPSNDGASSEVNGAQVPAAPGSCEEGEDAGGPKPDAGPMDTGEDETPAELAGLAGTVIPVFTSQVAAYLQRLGHSCRVSAELAGRVDSNLLDAELALVRELSWGKEEFAELREFASELSTAVHSADLAEPSSTPNSPSSFDVGRGTSSAAAELQGSGAGRETPCLETLQVEQEEPSRLADIARPMQNVLQASEKAIPKPTYVPEYLPEYPDPHTFKQTPVYEAVLTDFEIWRKRRSTLKDTARSNLTQFFNPPKGISVFKNHTFPQLPGVIAKPDPKASFLGPILAGYNAAVDDREAAAQEEYNFEGHDFTAQDLETARTTIKVKIDYKGFD